MALQSIYPIKKEKSISTTLEWKGWPEALNGFDNKAWVLATLHYGVFVGEVVNGKIEWKKDFDDVPASLPQLEEKGFPDARQISELRIFDTHKEAYFWKDGSELLGRLRKDGAEGDEVIYTETNLYSRGVVSRKLFDVLKTKKEEPIYIITRNYIGQNAIGQAGYVDCRFVEFKK